MRTLIPTIMLAVTVALLAAGAHAQQTVSGKILIKLATVAKTDDDARKALAAMSESDHVALTFERRSVLGWVVAGVATLGDEETKAVVELLMKDKRVQSAQLIGIEHALATPNDPRFSELWGLEMADVPTAWDTTVGTSAQRIGLIDSGINRQHQDLAPKDVAGFDFISDPSNALDGDGRDADYTDSDVSGDFHGSHVAGIMLASANDGVGIPGINWNAGLVTARALGTQGGSQVDIGEAAIWLAGGHVDGVPDIGANKVSVINMSLGGPGQCSPFEQDVYGAVVASGVTVVVAAGNDGAFTPTEDPGNCPGVIAVGAVGPTGELASYSNLDATVSVVAPGGDGNGDPTDSSVSILSVDGSGDFGYVAFDGTSMATPHVTGVVSLMQALNPRLAPSQIKTILEASPFTCAGNTCNNISFLDASSAVQLAQQTTGTLTGEPVPGDANSGGGDGCGPNSQLSSDGQTCLCNPGFVVNATQDGCVASGGTGGGGTGGGGGGANDGCPANSHDAGDGLHCNCNDGFVVNSAQTACVANGNGGGGGSGGTGGAGGQQCTVSITHNDCSEGFHCDGGTCVEDKSDSSRDSSSGDASGGGCSSSGATPSLLAFASLALIFVRRHRRPARQQRATPRVAKWTAIGVVAPIVAMCIGATGCAHMVHIESAPGADVYVNDQHVGTSPATYQETTGSPDPVKVTVKKNGKERTVMVPRNDVDMGAVGAGAAAGVGGCLASNVVLGVASFVFFPCAFAFPVSWALLGVGPGYGWYYGHKMPDNIHVDLEGGPPAVAEAPREPAAAAAAGPIARY